MNQNQLAVCILRLAQLQGQPVDRLAVVQTIKDIHTKDPEAQPKEFLASLLKTLQMPAATWLTKAQPENVPAILCNGSGEWSVLRGQNAAQKWVIESIDATDNRFKEIIVDDLEGHLVAKLKLVIPYSASKSPVFQQVSREFFSHKRPLLEAALGGIVINIIVLATSLYSMQVYDRVVPTGAEQTLWVLTLGVIVANIFEMIAKFVRSALYERIIDSVDQRMARSVFVKFLAIRLDQLPKSVGSMASQLRGYESVRAFLSTITNQLLVDAPFALFFALVVAYIAGWLSLIPLAFFAISLAIGIYSIKQVEILTSKATAAANIKTGILVEVIEGAETIKSGQGGWRLLTRWMNTTDEARGHESKMRHLTEYSQYVMALLQQLSYVALVATGAMLVSKGQLTMGGLIACSILSGRILAPVAAIPAQLVQWGHTKAAMQGLDRVWVLEDDHGNQNPIQLATVEGGYMLEGVDSLYAGNRALRIEKLQILPGQKIGILGPIGAGKTTLLRLLSGMYKPQAGRVLLDGVDITQIYKPVLADNIGYLQQEGRLFAGTIRENLILGMLDPGDEAILQATRSTGLYQSVIAAHPKGLLQEIFEGGTGLSGGQRQLVNLTRIFLRKPCIWLLDEPTASMDRNLEMHIMAMFAKALKSSDTFILVTHKPEMLSLVDRLIVIANHQIVLDGSKEEVLAQLQRPPTPAVTPIVNNASKA